MTGRKALARYRYRGLVFQFEPGKEPAGAEPVKKAKKASNKGRKAKNKAAEPKDK